MTNEPKKILMKKALQASLGNVTAACSVVGISRETHYQWLRKDSKYKHFVENIIPDIEVNFYEQQLRKKAEGGDTTAIIFGLKCKGKRQGWIDRQEIEHSGKVNLDIEEWEKRIADLMTGKKHEEKSGKKEN